MIPLSDKALSVLQYGYKLYLSVESWYDGKLLADKIPVASASEEVDRSQAVPERVTFTVPRFDAATGISWSPTTYTHPLAANGQRIRVQLGIDIGNGQVEWFTRGWYVIKDAKKDGDAVTVTAVGLLFLVDEARLITPFQPSGTLVSTLRSLVEPAVTVVIDSNLVNRSVPSGLNYTDNRLDVMQTLLNAWPAMAQVDPDGFLDVVPTTVDPTPVLSLTDGLGGTIIRATGESTRDGAYNVIVAQGTASDGGQVQGVAYVGGPRAVGGPFNALPVPYFYSSPLLTTNAQCDSAAKSLLATLQRKQTIAFDIEMVPHPGLQQGDVVKITTDQYDGLLCTLEKFTLPWIPEGDTPMTATVRSLT